MFVSALAIMSTADDKLDRILDQLKALGPIQYALEDLKSSMREVKEEVRVIQFDVASHEDRLVALERDMKDQKDMANQQQQQLRSLTLRLMNFPVSVDESLDNNAGLKAKVYEVVLKPLLVAAKAAKDLSSIPQVSTIIESCFRPFNSTAASGTGDKDEDKGPPHVIIKIASKPLKIALLKHRKNLPKPISTDVKRLFLVEDLTPATHKMMVAVSKAGVTEKTWTIDGNIKFTLTGSSTVHTVKSVFVPLSQVLNK